MKSKTRKGEFEDGRFLCPYCKIPMPRAKDETLFGGIKAAAWKCPKCGEGILEPKAAQKALLLNKKMWRKKCADCGEPLSDHCDGCCEDTKFGLKIKKFCGKKGNEITRVTKRRKSS